MMSCLTLSVPFWLGRQSGTAVIFAPPTGLGQGNVSGGWWYLVPRHRGVSASRPLRLCHHAQPGSDFSRLMMANVRFFTLLAIAQMGAKANQRLYVCGPR